MKRNRIMTMNFDSRAGEMTNLDNATPEIKEQREMNQDNIRVNIAENYGTKDLEQKIQRFTEFGNIPFLITWKYNAYFHEIRRAYVAGSPYSALVSSCTLVERILNYLFILLRSDYGIKEEFILNENQRKILFNHQSFSKWNLIIPIMKSWKIIDDESDALLTDLRQIRDMAIHYNASMDEDIYSNALNAIHKMIKYIDRQFNAVSQPYLFYHAIDGAIYVKENFRLDHYVKKIILPNTQLVSTNHKISGIVGPIWKFEDVKPRKYKNLSDEQFLWYRERFLKTTKQRTYTPQPGQKANIIVSTVAT